MSVQAMESQESVDAALQETADASWVAAQRSESFERYLMPVIGTILLVVVWWLIIVVFKVPPYIAPSPVAVAVTFVEKFQLLFSNLVPTALEALGGFLIGNVLAVATATVFVHSRRIERIVYPVAVLLNSIPIVAKVPILILLLGNGMEPKIAIAALIVYFPTLVNMVRGLQAVSPQSMELMHILSATKAEVFWRLRLQTSLPYLFSALKIAASTATLGAIVGEWIGSQAGIGALIIQATYNFDSELLYATVLMGAFFSLAFFLVILGAERAFVRWQPDAR
jgi:NitT/TauT family transport system permease protein